MRPGRHLSYTPALQPADLGLLSPHLTIKTTVSVLCLTHTHTLAGRHETRLGVSLRQSSPGKLGSEMKGCSPLGGSTLWDDSSTGVPWAAAWACLLPRMLCMVFLKGQVRGMRPAAPLPSCCLRAPASAACFQSFRLLSSASCVPHAHLPSPGPSPFLHSPFYTTLPYPSIPGEFNTYIQ